MLPGTLDFLILKLVIDSFTKILSLFTLIVSLLLESSIVGDRPGVELTVGVATGRGVEGRDRPGVELTVLEATEEEAEDMDRPGMELTVLDATEDEPDGGGRLLVGAWGRGDWPELCLHVGWAGPSEGEPPWGS